MIGDSVGSGFYSVSAFGDTVRHFEVIAAQLEREILFELSNLKESFLIKCDIISNSPRLIWEHTCKAERIEISRMLNNVPPKAFSAHKFGITETACNFVIVTVEKSFSMDIQKFFADGNI